MALITVTVEKGTLYSESYKSPKIVSESVTLSGNSVTYESNKVTAIEGRILKNPSNEDIGYFSYNNNGRNPQEDPYNSIYNSSVTINKKEDAFLQVEATNALLSGISKLEETITL